MGTVMNKGVFYLINVMLFLTVSCVTTQKKVVKYIFVKNGKSGLLSEDGEIVVPNQYKSIRRESKDFLLAYGKSSIYILNKYGEIVKEVGEIGETHESFLFATDKDTKKWGVLNSKGEWIILPNYLGMLNCLSENVIPAIDAKKEQWGILDKKGRWLLSPRYLSIVSCPKFGVFRVAEKTISGVKQFAGFNMKGNRLYGESYDDIWIYKDFAVIAKNGKRAVVDRNGKTYFGGWHDKIFYEEGTLIVAKDGDIQSIISQDGLRLIETSGLIFREDREHLLSPQINIYSIQNDSEKEVVMIDVLEKKILKTIKKIKEIKSDPSEFYIILKSGERQCFSYHDTSVTTMKCSSRKKLCEKAFGAFPIGIEGKACSDFFIKKVGKNYSLVRRDGRVILPPIYSKIIVPSSFNDREDRGIIMVKKNSKWGFFDLNSVKIKQITRLEYDNVCPFNNGVAKVKKDKKRFMIDKTGKVVFEIDVSYQSVVDIMVGVDSCDI